MARKVLDDASRKDGWGGTAMRFHANDIPLIERAMLTYGRLIREAVLRSKIEGNA
jgi:hypothetical protein